MRFLSTLFLLLLSSLLLANSVPRSGDYKEGYDSESYKTDSLSLQKREGKVADLLAIFRNPPLGLPKLAEEKRNPMTREGVELGRRLFFDRRLSLNDTMSCAICHVPEMGFTNQELETAIGFEGKSGKRNTPTMLNVAYRKKMFFDGREDSLTNQIWSPLLAHNEMANPSVGSVINKIKSIKGYREMFAEVFGDRGITIETIGQAIAQYSRTLLSANSRFDRWYYGKEQDALNESEQRGFTVFAGKGACVTCHIVGEKHALFFDNQLHNTGLGYDVSMRKDPPATKVQIAPGVYVDVEQKLISNFDRARNNMNDLGRYEVTQNPHDRWKYLTPTLRNVALTGPYMHNGSMDTLEEVIEFYDKGGIPNELLSPLIRPLKLSAQEKEDLRNFLLTLTGSNYSELVYDAFAAPVGDPTADGPKWLEKKPYKKQAK